MADGAFGGHWSLGHAGKAMTGKRQKTGKSPATGALGLGGGGLKRLGLRLEFGLKLGLWLVA